MYSSEFQTAKPLEILSDWTDGTRVNKRKVEDEQPTLSEAAWDLNRHHRGRVAIFIDGSNLFHAAWQLGIEIDYAKLLRYLTAGARLLRAFFYTGVDPTNLKQQSFLLWMRHHGYRVVTKEITQFPDGSKKADMDVIIAVDMMTLVDHYDTAVLVSGDGDLAYAVKQVSYRGARVEVVSLRSMTSDELLGLADFYLDLEVIKEYIQKTLLEAPSA